MAVGSGPRPGSVIAGYRLERLLGRGGMGAVYVAEDVRLGRKLALKLLAPELAQSERFRERFLRESQLAASLDHPNIVPIYAAGEADGQLYLAMRYVEGSDLKQLLAVEGRLEPGRALTLLEQVADALDAAHVRGLIHRDVKPGNILIAAGSGREYCYLADFGLTKQSASISGLTGTGELMGTVSYVAPEQIRGESAGPAADTYSLACVLYECLTGQPPFPRESDVASLWAHVHEPPAPASDARPELGTAIDEVLAHGLAKDAADRPTSGSQLINQARGALALPPRGAGRSHRRRRVLASLAIATVVAVAVSTTAILIDGSGTPTLSRVDANALGILDTGRGTIKSQVRIGVAPTKVAIGEGAIWVTSTDDNSVYRIDPATDTVRQTIAVGKAPSAVAIGNGAVWVVNGTDGTVKRIDPSTNRVVQTIPVGNGPNGIAFGDDAIWCRTATTARSRGSTPRPATLSDLSRWAAT